MNARRNVQGKLISNAVVLDLMDLCLTDRASPEQWKTFSDLIVAQPEVRDCFAAQAKASARLALIAQFDAVPEVAPQSQAEKATLSLSGRKRLDRRIPILPVSRGAWIALAIGLAAVLICCCTIVGYRWMTPGINQQLIAASGPVPPAVQVFGLSGEAGPRNFFGGDEIELPLGKYKAKTSAGAQLQLTGPLRIRVVRPLHWRLYYGKLIAEVPSEGHGFTIQTDQASVVDLGTKFGVAVDRKGDSKIIVYDGSVELTSGSARRNMAKGDAFAVPTTGKIEELAFMDPISFLEYSDIPLSVISEVHHNGADQEATYQIMRGGFVEDAPAYTDRIHQWNGVLASGLPPQLVGLDYVRMANDWKFDDQLALREDLTITYQFSRPAVAYLLVDERLPKPEWLRRDFADTGWLVGLDKGSHHDQETKINYELEQAKGAGASIDVVLRVWRVILPQGGELKVGPIGNRADDWVLPCLVARPI
ncbi:FecR domain-containing protein [Blastopirellula marina]|uniref:FecR protein domain-containing protein n=1 Tax=Blastopirellula marina DSM 3645 TaxID=314230 RepID=A3ZQE5_9BACT|nr:hypothetical protein [Blastopirellula marina]EAQ81421.1 hypothetical protein DSM3645_23556 [Blastopirellula marina DSM 3645]